MVNVKQKKYNLAIILILFILFLIPLLSLLGEEITYTIIIPLFFGFLATILTTLLVHYYSKDKFIPQIYIITVLFHFIVAIFIQLLKYHILNLPTSLNNFAGIGIDNDGLLYHNAAIEFIQYQRKLNDMTIFPIIISIIYKFFGINEFSACCFNCIISGFISITIYKLGLNLYNNKNQTKLMAYITAFSFTIAAYTSVLMRDVYIMLLSYLIIYFYYFFYKKKNILYLLFSLVSFIILCFFRAYAAGAVLCACIITHLVIISSFKFKNKKIKINRYMLIIMILCGILYYIHQILKVLPLIV